MSLWFIPVKKIEATGSMTQNFLKKMSSARIYVDEERSQRDVWSPVWDQKQFFLLINWWIVKCNDKNKQKVYKFVLPQAFVSCKAVFCFKYKVELTRKTNINVVTVSYSIGNYRVYVKIVMLPVAYDVLPITISSRKPVSKCTISSCIWTDG